MAMTPRTQFLLQLLQKLGAPLMGAVAAHSREDDGGKADASTMASLLSESVKVSISLSQAMSLKTSDGDTDAIRVALAALAAGLISDSYAQTGRIPGENDSRRISKALESVIVFADNFAPAAEHAKRLELLDGTPPFFDPVQTNIYAILALLPAIAAVSEFSFGQSDVRLIQEISDRLDAKAKELLTKLGLEAGAVSELVILQALGKLYAGAHREATKALRNAGDDSAAASIDTVWASFDRQVSMLEVLMTSMGGMQSPASSGTSRVQPDQAPEQPAAEAPAVAPPPASPPAGNPGSPMSFFKKK